MIYTRILGTGSYLPSKILSNADLEKMVDTTDQWIMERTGVKNRHIQEENENTTSMALIAAQRAIEAAKIDPKEIDLIIVPGIVFDLRGFRIGYGEGYYDRLLKSAGVPKIGLAYEFQMRDKLPKESHDVCVDKIITENRIIECGGELK